MSDWSSDVCSSDLMKGLFYSDPTSVPEADLRSAAGILLPDPAFPVAPPLERAFLRGGDYAVLRHKGPYSDMRAAYDWLYGEWLVQSSREEIGRASGREREGKYV